MIWQEQSILFRNHSKKLTMNRLSNLHEEDKKEKWL